MSESVSNDGESYSNGSSKYGSSKSWSSESPSSESHASTWRTPTANTPSAPAKEEDKISEIKKLLMEAETYLVEFSKNKFSNLSADIVKSNFRDLVVKNETSIIDYPTPNTLASAYQAVYNNLSDSEKVEPKNQSLMEGLNEFVVHKRQSTSKLKYW